MPLLMTSWPFARQQVKWAQGRCCRVDYSSPEHEAALNLKGQTCHSAHQVKRAQARRSIHRCAAPVNFDKACICSDLAP